jgi:hypothetical protein
MMDIHDTRTLDPNAYGLQLARVVDKGERFRYYLPVTFERPWNGCELCLRRARLFGLTTEQTGYIVDVLDAEGDILDTVGLTKPAFDYLKRVLKARVDWESERLDKGGWMKGE